MNPVQALQFYLFKIHFNNIIPSTPTLSKCSPSFRFPHENRECIYRLLSPILMKYVTHNDINWTIICRFYVNVSKEIWKALPRCTEKKGGGDKIMVDDTDNI
jgi:hypothetical protein